MARTGAHQHPSTHRAAVPPEQAAAIVSASGCTTAKVKVAEPGQSPGEDVERVAAVRQALGPRGAIRVDANAAWDPDEAVRRIRELDRAANGLEYVEQPCRELTELAAVRRKVDVRIAADESIRRAEDPLRVAVAEAADVAVIKPPRAVRRALQVAEVRTALRGVSAVESSVGLAAQLAWPAPCRNYRSPGWACRTAGRRPGGGLLLPVNGQLPVPRRTRTGLEAGRGGHAATEIGAKADQLRRVHALLDS